VVGYLSASIEWASRSGEPDAWRGWWEDPKACHRYFLGKDNAPFHAVWWPAILAGSGEKLHLPDDLVVNHYLTSGAKMSASRGVGFSLDESLDRVGVDPDGAARGDRQPRLPRGVASVAAVRRPAPSNGVE
jgi:methionyl-tRNA synthetase